MLDVVIIGYGAIGQALCRRLVGSALVNVTHVVVRAQKLAATQATLPAGVLAVVAVPGSAKLVLECAGHDALTAHVLGALRTGIECAVMSVGALSEEGLPEELASAAAAGNTQVHLLAGAVGGIDALAAAKQAGLESVTYTGRKPPLGWKGSPAEVVVNLETLITATAIFEGSARDAARLYPKNANVAATVSLPQKLRTLCHFTPT